MPKHAKAIVHESLIRWARETAGYSIEDVARRFKKTSADIQKWENGTDHPHMGQLNKMADMFGRPISDFFLPAPPKESSTPHDFRRSSGSRAVSYSPNLRKQLRFAQERRDLALYLLEELGNDVTNFDHRVNRRNSPETVGETIRELLGVCFEVQKSCRREYSALNMWRKLIEQQNILVFQFENVEIEEAWGFSIYEDRFPIVGINKKLAPNGRIFTMLHEITHLLLGQSRVCDSDDLTEQSQSSFHDEVFCNHTAAAAIMPENRFLSQVQEIQSRIADCTWEEESVKELALHFAASGEAVVRRLLTFNLITRERYRNYCALFEARAAKRAAREKERREQRDAKGGQAATERAVYDYGSTFVNAVLSSLNEQRITLADASQYLRVRANAVPTVEEILANGEFAI